MKPTAATGFAQGTTPSPELVVEAVKQALAGLESDYAHTLLLFLTTPYARSAKAAIAAAGRAARCLQVTGATCPGVLTENDWALHQPAAAVLALNGPISLGPVQDGEASLTLIQPDQFTADWLLPYPPRYGTLSTGPESGHKSGADGAVWGQGKLRSEGRFEASFHGARTRVAVSRGLRILSATLQVTDRDGFDLFYLSGSPALSTLLMQLPPEASTPGHIPLQRLCALILEPGIPSPIALNEGRYTVIPILSINTQERSVTLATALPEDSALIWAWREPMAAEHDTIEALKHLSDEPPGHSRPDFALMFSCIGRGPYFYHGEDLDLAQILDRYPALPVVGTYGAGEIAPFTAGNNLISYSSVITLVNSRV